MIFLVEDLRLTFNLLFSRAATFFSMSCCIIGSETLNELEDMVVSLGFGKITRKNLKRKTWLDSPYGKDQLGVKIEVKFWHFCLL